MQAELVRLLLGATAILLYLTTTWVLGRPLWRRVAVRFWSDPFASIPAIIAVCAHGYLLYLQLHPGDGIDLGLFNSISLVGWLINLFLLVALLSVRVENLFVVILPFTAISIAFSLFLVSQRLIFPTTEVPIQIHVLISVTAYATLTLAAFQALLLAIQDHRLHNHRPGGFISLLPPLQTMERQLFQFIGAGFILLSAALLTGFLFIEDIFAQHLVHKSVLSIFAWGVFGILLVGRMRFGWRGRTAIRWTLGGFIALMLAYLGTKLVLELILA